MDLFAWKNEYNLGVPAVDAQHKKLFGLANQLHEAMVAGKGKPALDRILKSLITYTQTHFAAEEKLMAIHHYPGLDRHKAQHEALTSRVMAYQGAYRTGKIALSVEVMEFLKNWLRHHVTVSDRQITPYVKKQKDT